MDILYFLPSVKAVFVSFVCASVAYFELVLKSLASSSARGFDLKTSALGRLKFSPAQHCLGLVLVPWSANGIDCNL